MHSSSLIAGMSQGTIDGIAFIILVWMLGMEVHLNESGVGQPVRRIGRFGGQFTAPMGRRERAATQFLAVADRQKPPQTAAAQVFFVRSRYRAGMAYFVLCKGPEALLYAAACEHCFACSSVAQR
jgi:hypothetical protein